MDESQTIEIHNQFDIVEARMQVRTLARQVGLDLFDQARISLAASTSAIILGLARREQGGQISMKRLADGKRIGVQVVCTGSGMTLHDLASRVLDDAERMVDSLTVEALPSNGIKVTLIKWASAGTYTLAPGLQPALTDEAQAPSRA